MRIGLVAAVVSLALVSVVTAQQASASIRMPTGIPAQPLGSALQKFSADRDLQLVYRTDIVGNLKTRGATGDLTVEEALRQLLSGTGLTYRFLDEKTVTVLAASGSAPTASARQTQRASLADEGGYDGGQQDAQKGGLWERFRVAQVDPTASSRLGQSVAAAMPGETNKLEEIVVTAQKREERLQDVPVPVTVLDAQVLAELNQNRMQDYFTSVPGLSLTGGTGFGGAQALAIRGVTSGANSNPTVGVMIDDVPYGSSTFLGFGEGLSPDIDPSDLARVEVLRGPQGTLYGASSMGGLIKFVTKDPSTTAVSGRVQVIGDEVKDGGYGYGLRGAVNVPVSDTFAVRASGFSRRDPGYIDNVLTGETDVNHAKAYGGRFSALWNPTPAVSIKIAALLQDIVGNGNPAVDANSLLQPILGDLKQARLRGTEGYTAKARLYSATLTAKVAGLDFVSVSGYSNNTYDYLGDYTSAFGGFFAPDDAASYPNHFQTEKFTQEFRLSTASGRHFDWLAGAYYTHESSSADQSFVANNAVTGAPIGLIIDFNYPSSVQEYAVFGDLTVHFTDRFEVQFGGRESENRQVYNETDTGPEVGPFYFGAPSPYVNPTERTQGNAFTYLVTPQFKISPDLMVYARFNSGYRVGGPNVNAIVYGVPLKSDPDKTYNYELGIKGAALDRALTFDASVYYIDWQRVQITLSNPNFIYTANAGSAKSQGVELSLQAKPIQGLTIAVAASVNDAELTEALPPPPLSNAAAPAGAHLPFSSRFSGSLSAEQEFVLAHQWSGFVGGSVSYVGSREGEFVSAGATRLRFPAYTDLDLRAGARYDSWTVSLFANNVANRRGILGGRPSSAQSAYEAVFIQPRTIGINAVRAF